MINSSSIYSPSTTTTTYTPSTTTVHRGVDYGTAGSSTLGAHLHYVPPVDTSGYDRAVNEALSHFAGEGAACYVIRRGDGLYTYTLSKDGGPVEYTRLFKTDKGSSKLEADVLDSAPDTYPSVGWFQDAAGELYCHEGEGHWQGINLARCKELTKAASNGELEFIS